MVEKKGKTVDWLLAQQAEINRERCAMCLHQEGLAALHEILGLMREHKAHQITKLMIHKRIAATVAGFEKAVPLRTLQNHLQCHDRAKWDAAKGRG